jgi:hypothetical protein
MNMFGRSHRHFGPPWAQREEREGSESRSFGPRGHHHEGHHRHGWHNLSPEQLALRSTAAEVARLFWIASQSSESPEQRARLRAFLESARTELSDLIYGTSPKENSAETPTDGPQV